jgi:hypothetical protein
LKRYLGEFDFRYNNRVALHVDDDMRATKLLEGIEGKRLTYRRTDETANTQAEGESVSALARQQATDA